MADRNDIISLPHSSLRTKSELVTEFGDSLIQLINRMEQATIDWEESRDHEVGVALAAVQIDNLQRVVIIRRDNTDPDNKEFDVYINPEITRFEGEPKLELEGCLSVSDIYAYVPRYPKVKIKAMNIHGKTIKQYARGFLARIFQHEIDHTNGITFVDRVGPDDQYYHINDGRMKPITDDKTTELMEEFKVNGKIRADIDNN